MKYPSIFSSLIVAALAVMLVVPAAAQEGEIDFGIDISGIGEIQTDGPNVTRSFSFALPTAKPSTHWIGVGVAPVSPLLKKHLRIDGGLAVTHAAKETPAAKAGIKKDDILLKMNDTSVANMKGLMEFLTDNGEDEVEVTLLREGKKKTFSLKPQKRPAAHARLFGPGAVPKELRGEFPGDIDAEEIRKWIEKAMKEHGRPDLGDDARQRLQLIRPGVVIGADAFAIEGGKGLPEGLQIAIIAEGDGPAKITVKRGDDSWEVTEKQLDKLPEDVRAHVKRFLNRSKPSTMTLRSIKPLEIKPFDKKPGGVHSRAFRMLDSGLEKEFTERFDEIDKQLEAILNQLESINQDK